MSTVRINCINCQQPKADSELVSPYCANCLGVIAEVRKVADEKQWGKALYDLAKHNALQARQPALGMQGKMDPRTVTDRISTEALQRRFGV